MRREINYNPSRFQKGEIDTEQKIALFLPNIFRKKKKITSEYVDYLIEHVNNSRTDDKSTKIEPDWERIERRKIRKNDHKLQLMLENCVW